jgi:hypothetical protein
MVSAQACRAWGCGFESRLPRHFKTENSCLIRQAAVFFMGLNLICTSQAWSSICPVVESYAYVF